jgi:hypothetical protein
LPLWRVKSSSKPVRRINASSDEGVAVKVLPFEDHDDLATTQLPLRDLHCSPSPSRCSRDDRQVDPMRRAR